MSSFTSVRRRALRLATGLILVASGFGLAMSNPALGAGSTATGAAEAPAFPPCRDANLFAEQLPDAPGGDVRLGYGLTPDTASIPGPLFVLYEGECINITLHNDIPAAVFRHERAQYGFPDLPLGVTIHPHGVRYRESSDGTAMSHSITKPGGSRTYTWYAAQATAGYWWYHDHNIGTEHGTGGQRAGLWGGLIIRKAGDPLPDVPTFVVAFGDNATINLQHYPNTPVYTATEGQRVEFLVFAWGEDHHSFHLHGHSWADNRNGVLDPNDPYQRIIDDVGLEPAQSFGFQVIAGSVSGPGDWMLHCHVQSHSDAGMWTVFRVLPPAGG